VCRGGNGWIWDEKIDEIDKDEIYKEEIDKDKEEIDKEEIDKDEIDKDEIDKDEIDKDEIDKEEIDSRRIFFSIPLYIKYVHSRSFHILGCFIRRVKTITLFFDETSQISNVFHGIPIIFSKAMSELEFDSSTSYQW